jgi:hypothetical protein
VERTAVGRIALGQAPLERTESRHDGLGRLVAEVDARGTRAHAVNDRVKLEVPHS